MATSGGRETPVLLVQVAESPWAHHPPFQHGHHIGLMLLCWWEGFRWPNSCVPVCWSWPLGLQKTAFGLLALAALASCQFACLHPRGLFPVCLLTVEQLWSKQFTNFKHSLTVSIYHTCFDRFWISSSGRSPFQVCSFLTLSLRVFFFFFLEYVLHFYGLPGGSDSKESACNVGYPSLIPELGRSPDVGNSNPLQYSCGKCHGQKSPAGYSPWGCKESDMTEHAHKHTIPAHRNHYPSFTVA